MVGRREALIALLRYLKATDYSFTAVTPATHERVLVRPAPTDLTLADIFGWNREFDEASIKPQVLEWLLAADALGGQGRALRSRLRVASVGGELFFHSAFPTEDRNAVFFGPDTYRFVRFITQQMPRFADARRLVDMGSGSGAGAIVAARRVRFDEVTMVDMNPIALELAQVNADVAGVSAGTLLSSEVPPADLIIANPPYMMDEAKRSYRDGGDLLGGGVAAAWARQAIERLRPGGAMLLYTGVAYSRGKAPAIAALAQLCADAGAELEVQEIDPDVFGEELDKPAYREVERIAAIGALITTRR